MRDILTALAGAVILILVAALAVPPLVAWESYRTLVDRTIGTSLGLDARTEGRIAVRLLPSPQLSVDRLRIGGQADKPALDLTLVKAEIGLTPLLTGEIRFTETRIGRAEITLPISEDDAVRLPADLYQTLAAQDLAVEDLNIGQVILTTVVPQSGRTDQVRAETVHLSAPRLLGPWRIEGLSGTVPFRIATGEPLEDGSVAVKFSGGGDTHPRFEADTRIRLEPMVGEPSTQGSALRAMIPKAEGSARIVVGPPVQVAGAYLPFSIGGTFKARGPVVRFSDVKAEIDPGGQAMRLGGTGRIDLRAWRAALTLEARRLDLDAFLLSTGGQALLARGMPRAGSELPMMVDLDLGLDSIALGLDEWTGLRLSGTFDRTGGLALRRFAVTTPGDAALTASGDIDTQPALRFTGTVSLDAAASDGFGRYLRKFGLGGPAIAVMDGRPIQATADLSSASPALSLRNLRLSLGEARITGNARYTQAEPGGRGRFDAQLSAQGIDVATLPAFGSVLSGLHDHDVGLTIQARDVRYGPAGAHSGNGTISASIQSDGASLNVGSLDVTDLAGANAKLSGRIAADGSGRIAGRMSAPVAAPLIALLDRTWIAETRMIPAFLRAGALDLAVTLEREAGAADTLRTSASGTAAGGSLDLDLLARGGRIDNLSLALTTPVAGRWFEREDMATLRKPAALRIVGTRGQAAADGAVPPLGLDVSGTIADLTLSTVKPVVPGPGQTPPEAGEIRARTPDLAPFLMLAGSTAALPSPLPAELLVGLTRAGRDAHADVSGRIAGATIIANLNRSPEGDIFGSVALGRLSLPWLAASLVIPPEGKRTEAGDGARFAAPPPARPPIDLDVRADTLDLGRRFTAEGAAFGARLDNGVLTVRDFSGRLAGGRLTGSITLSRQGGAAAIAGEAIVSDASIAELTGPGPISGQASATLRFGASGQSVASMANNLGGSGEIALTGLVLPGGDPGGIERALGTALGEDDPLRDGRLQALVAEELAAAPMAVRGTVKAPATLVGGSLRAAPLAFDLGGPRWAGTLSLDLTTGRIDARGTLTAGGVPKGWSAGFPSVQLGYSGPLTRPERSIDAGPLTNGLAAVVLQRELEKIELFEADQIERQRRRARIEMDKARAVALKAAAEKAALEKAAIEKLAAEEAARQAKLKAERAAAAEKAASDRAAAEEAERQARIRADQEAARQGAAPAPQP
ncbi:AsmA family protein [Methylobacterium sp. 77]|uniref:AsmA family protein n=1 Tax=Methylobacterium sp. 77 TaxID=1101192 RepID=UPI00037B06F9|nr:AsmA family protein [Methylobacterium sp. 77]